MNEAEKKQLSREVAELYKISAYYTYEDRCERMWLHEDSARVFDLCAEELIDINFYSKKVVTAFIQNISELVEQEEFCKNHNNDRKQAARIAAMKALKAKKEGEK